MLLEYLVNNIKKSTSATNGDITFINDNVIKANKEVKLLSAVKSFEFAVRIVNL